MLSLFYNKSVSNPYLYLPVLLCPCVLPESYLMRHCCDGEEKSPASKD